MSSFYRHASVLLAGIQIFLDWIPIKSMRGRQRAGSLTLLALLLLSACTNLPDSCQNYSELACIQASACELELKQQDYICRANKNSCEEGFKQWPDRNSNPKTTCEAKANCEFDPGKCYCPPFPNIRCICGGGEPPRCLKK